jgi:hypothetical protein
MSAAKPDLQYKGERAMSEPVNLPELFELAKRAVIPEHNNCIRELYLQKCPVCDAAYKAEREMMYGAVAALPAMEAMVAELLAMLGRTKAKCGMVHSDVVADELRAILAKVGVKA